MKKNLHIAAIIDQPGFLEDMVEKLASLHSYSGSDKKVLPYNRKAIKTSSTETYVSGTIVINDVAEQINMPFITSFLFTCTKQNNGRCKLEWSFSMS